MSLLGRLLASLLLALPVAASEAAPRPDGHAPIGVMADHVHHSGEIMFSYRYARMQMSGNRSRTEQQSKGDVFRRGFVITPTNMDMQMHVFGAMWAPTDRITLMGMLPFVKLSMDHQNVVGGRFTTETSGIGDVKLAGLIGLLESDSHRVHLNAGFSFPTGSTTERGDVLTPMGERRLRLPYPMQTGSGSVDAMPGITYTGKSDALSWGAQALGTVRLFQNRQRYELGDRVDLTAWLARPWTSWLSTSVRASFGYWGNIQGADPQLNPNAVPTADPDRRGGWRLDLWPGLNFLTSTGHRFAVEVGLPAAQWLYGPQLETDWRLVVGWQKAFGPFDRLGF
jgi:hypothetical protein